MADSAIAGSADLAIDHAVIAVEDLSEAVARFGRRNGLVVGPGGRHPAFGTANRLVALRDSYIELVGLETDDKLGTAWLASAVHWAVQNRRPLMAVALRTSDIVTLRNRLRAVFPALPELEQGSRVSSNGETLSWRIQHVVDQRVPVQGPAVMPFFIEWSGTRPGTAPVPAHSCGVEEIRRVVIGVRGCTPDIGRLQAALGPQPFLDFDETADPGVQSIELSGRETVTLTTEDVLGSTLRRGGAAA